MAQTVTQAIMAAAKATGANATLLLATSLVEDPSQAWSIGGDYVNGSPTSFGPFQFHEGGALGSHPASWASTYAAVLNRAEAFVRAGVTTGAGAAAVQGPQDPAGYAVKVNAAIPQASAMIAAAGGTVATVQPSSGGSSDVGNSLTYIVKTQLGVPYSFDGGAITGPTKGTSGKVGFDCSGLVEWAYGQVGILLPHNAAAQYALGVPVDKSNLQAGDVVFFEPSASGPGHEGLYIGNGQFVAAPHTGSQVDTENLADRTDYVGARRYAAPVAVNRGGKILSASAGQLVSPDQTLTKKNTLAALTKVLNLSGTDLLNYGIRIDGSGVHFSSGPKGGGPTTVGAYTGNTPASSGGSIFDSATGFVTDELPHAMVWLMLAIAGLGLIYLGAKRAIAPEGTP